jgi:hypothetical protein
MLSRSAGVGHSATSASSSSSMRVRANVSNGDDAISVASSAVVGFVVPEGRYNPFITQNLRKVRTTKSGKFSLDYCVGNRLAKIETYKSRLESLSGCATYFTTAADPSKNMITIVADDVEQMVAGINAVSSINERLKVHGKSMVTVDVPIPTFQNILPVFNAVECVTTFETPVVTYSIGTGKISISGPEDQVAISTQKLTAAIGAIPAPITKTNGKTNGKGSRQGAKSAAVILPKSVSEVESKVESKVDEEELATRRRFVERYLQMEEAENALFDVADDSGCAGVNAITDAEPELSVSELNRMTKPPSKAESMRMKASGGGSHRRAKLYDYEIEEGQIYAVITRLDGGNKVGMKVISIDDDLYQTECRGRISGAMSKRSSAKSGKKIKSSNRIAIGQVVIASKRDFEDKWIDVVQKVPDDVIGSLIKSKVIPRSYFDNPFAEYGSSSAGVSSGKSRVDDACGFYFSRDGESEEDGDGSYDSDIDFDRL